jgi:electron transfer flavoprotein alpha subunit
VTQGEGAPVFRVVDLGLVGRLFEIVREPTEKL